MASKHYRQTSISLDMREWDLIGKLAQRTHVSRAHFVREALRSVIIKYKGLLADEEGLDLSAYEAAPAHAALLRQRRDPSQTIQPHEGVTYARPESEPPPAAVPSDEPRAAPTDRPTAGHALDHEVE